MPPIILSNISHAFADHQLLADVNFTLPTGSRIALAGANGSGKTTLMRIISGALIPDSGKVVCDKNARISYLPQSGLVHSGSTLYREAEKAFAWGDELIRDKEGLEQELAALTSESTSGARLVEAHHSLSEKLTSSGYYQRQEAIGRVLSGLGFKKEEYSENTAAFSGGWQMRIALAKILLENPDTLLLDEPTNYLDLEARNWLESFLTNFRGSVLVVSHDRYFLDVTVDSVAELYSGKLNLYTGNYSEYEKALEKKLAEIERSYNRQQEEIARLQGFIRRFRYKASKARQVQSRIKLLERLERIELPPVVKNVHFTFSEAPRSAKLVLELDGIGKAYGNNDVFQEVGLQLSAGQRLALVGINGAGKSTLMRLMAGVEKPDSGMVRYGKNVSVGYFSQELTDKLNYEESVLETIESWAAVEDIPNLRHLLGAFLFRSDDIYKSVRILSGGEKSRLAILRLLLQPANLLFLDEPTNHLDMASKDILLSALEKYSGALVFVSHDRYFIESLANRVLELNRGRAHYYFGDYRYYLWKKEGEQKEEIPEKAGKRAKCAKRTAESDGKKGEAYTRRLKGRQLKSTFRKLTREEEEVMAGLEELQQEATRLEETMSYEEAYRNGGKMRELKQRLEENQRLQQESLRRWEIIDSELKELKLLEGV